MINLNSSEEKGTFSEKAVGKSYDAARTVFQIYKHEILDISLLTLSADSLILRVNEFHYGPKADQTVADWFETCEDIFQTISPISQ